MEIEKICMVHLLDQIRSYTDIFIFSVDKICMHMNYIDKMLDTII